MNIMNLPIPYREIDNWDIMFDNDYEDQDGEPWYILAIGIFP
jgi:hypothetical protein